MSFLVNGNQPASLYFNNQPVNTLYYNNMLVWPESDWKATIVSAAITKKETGEWPSYIEPGYEVGIMTNYGEVKLRLISVDEEGDGVLIFQQCRAFADANGKVIKNGLLDNSVIIEEKIFEYDSFPLTSTLGYYRIPKCYVVAGAMASSANQGYWWRIQPEGTPWQCGDKYRTWDLSYSEVNSGASYEVTGDFTHRDQTGILSVGRIVVSWDFTFEKVMYKSTDFSPTHRYYSYLSQAKNRICYDENGKPVTYALRSYKYLDGDDPETSEDGALSCLIMDDGNQAESYEEMANTDGIFYGVSANGTLTTVSAASRPYRFPCMAFKVGD